MALIPGSARLQLRWEDAPPSVRRTHGEATWLCNYELVIPLAEIDPRGYDDNGNRVRAVHVVEMTLPQLRISFPGNPPCRALVSGGYTFDPPFRLRFQVVQDSKVLGLPLVVIALDGTVIEQPDGWHP